MGIIKLKRGQSANLPVLTLEAGEPAFSLDTGKLYIGDGTDKVLINPDQANAETATKLKTARTITLTGDATGSTTFDGSANVSIAVTQKNSGVTAGTYTKVTVDAKGNVTAGTSLSASDIPTLTLAKISDVGTVASKNVGTASGNVPVLNAQGKLDDAILPALAITDTFVVANQTAMLALTAEVGDVAIRTDLNKSFILKTSPASTLANWQEVLSPIAPVQSVAGKTGNVTLAPSDIGAEPAITKGTAFNVNYETSTANIKANGTVAVGTSANVARADHVHPIDTTRAPLASPTFTGTPTAPTPTTADNTTKIATTAFVKAQGYLTSGSVIDGGIF